MKQQTIILTLLITLFLVSENLYAQTSPARQIYEETYEQYKELLQNPKPGDFKKAVVLSENAYLEGNLDLEYFNNMIALLTEMCQMFIHNSNLEYTHADKKEVEKWGAIFTMMTDTTTIAMVDGDSISAITHLPFSYDFQDIWGEKDWTQMFVSKLLEQNTGNCHSLPYLYKILAQELGTNAHLSLAPNHVYIKHWSQKTGWFNTELTSATFPIDAWVMASGYIHTGAIQSGIYMDTLSESQSIALCVFDLAKGFERKFGTADLDFIIKCCDLSLQYYPHNVNTLLLRAETLKKKYEHEMEIQGAEYATDLFDQYDPKTLWDDMEQTYTKIFQLGYRNMPKEMYLQWLAELKTEKEKYLNKKVMQMGSKK